MLKSFGRLMPLVKSRGTIRSHESRLMVLVSVGWNDHCAAGDIGEAVCLAAGGRTTGVVTAAQLTDQLQRREHWMLTDRIQNGESYLEV